MNPSTSLTKLAVLLVLVGCFTLLGRQTPNAVAQEIGFLEDFALAEDREQALKQLVPGTETYYFYHCLHFQNLQQLDKVDETLKPWIKRFGYTDQVNEIRNRQALLQYTDDPAASLAYLKQQLNLHFTHQREIPQAQRDLPTRLDPKLIDPKSLTALAMSRYQNTDGFTNAGLRMLAKTDLDKNKTRHLLNRLRFPDYPGLVDAIVRDLKERDSQPFGNLPIHQSLTLKQLEQLAKKLPVVSDQTPFVNIYLGKLAPSNDVNWRADVEEHQAYLDRLWSFAQTLTPVHNSLKANILYRKLELDQSQGNYDLELFKAYLALPRNVAYINPILVKEIRTRSHLANLSQNFNDQCCILPIHNDQQLVSDYLQHFLLTADDTSEFESFIESKFLQRQFATVKILNGLGDTEKWASLLTPLQYQELLKRVDLDFVATNPEHFQPQDEVELELFTKNVKTLIVKVFEINTENYYRKHDTEIDTNVNLDGLVPNFETTFEYEDQPALRIKRNFKLPQVKDRGVYVVDFIAGGKSSRALIRKGRLQVTSQTTGAGQLFTVIDENKNIVSDASLWISNRRHQPDEHGRILVPFSTQPGRFSAIIRQGNFSCLQKVKLVAENYNFTAAIFVDRESLTRSTSAKVFMRPSLRIAGGSAVPVGLLKDPKVVITTVNQDDISSTKIINEVELAESTETVFEFVVPPRLKTVTINFTAQIDNISRGRKDNVAASESFSVNAIDQSDIIQDLHLIPSAAGYQFSLLGKTGEPRPKQSVQLAIKVDGFKNPVKTVLQSDKNGRIELGELQNVLSITAVLSQGKSKTWHLKTADQTYPRTINGLAGTPVVITAPADWDKVTPARVALFEIRGASIVAAGRKPSGHPKQGTSIVTDRFDAVSLKNGQLELTGLDPGDYLLRLNYDAVTNRDGVHEITIKIAQGELAANVIVGEHRQLENRQSMPLQIAKIDTLRTKLNLQLKNTTPRTRVHVIANRYQPAFNAFGHFASVRAAEPWSRSPSIRKSVYMEGRKIGDEYQYILDRKYAAKYPGNMLQRPSLLINPWDTRETDNHSQSVAAGTEFGNVGNDADRAESRDPGSAIAETGNSDFANLDFLGSGAVVLANLTPDKNGRISIDRKQLGNFQQITIVALDAFKTCQRTVSLPLNPLKPRDSRLAHVLNADEHFTQSKQIVALKKNETLVIEDIVSARFQYYDDLSDVFRLLTTLNPNTELKKFEFVLTWKDLKKTKKQELYSQHACHELNFFLMKKDPAFFKSVVTKHLENKRDKTFLDHWLLNDNLDPFTDPWKYQRLNTVERILLAQRLETRSADIVRNVNESYLLSPTPRDRFDRLYDTSITGLGLDLNRKLDRQSGVKGMRGLPSLSMELAIEEMDEVEMADAGFSGSASGGGAPALKRPAAQPGHSIERYNSDPKDSLDSMHSRFSKESLGRIKNKPGKKSNRKLAELKEAVTDGKRSNLTSAGTPVSRMRIENRTRTVPITKMRSESRQRTLGDGTVESYQVEVPYTENVTQNYTVQVPDTEDSLINYLGVQRLREQSNRFYRRLPPTKQWMENNYYRLLPEQQTPELVKANRCWRDFANHEGGPFLSAYFPEAHRNFTEMMFVLSVLDLPMKADEAKQEFDDSQLTFTAAGPTIAFHQQVRPAIVQQGNTTILVSENFFQKNDRYRHKDGVRYDKFVSSDFHAHTLYGGQVVITNPTSTPRAIELLIQIPQGAVACSGSQDTKTTQFDLAAFSTQTFEYSFYFPTAGEFSHYPAHVSADEKVLAIADSVDFKVVDQPAKVNTQSWAYVSQNGSDDEVIEFINQENVLRLDLNKIAFRMKDKSFYSRTLKTLRNRYVYNHLLWSYSIQHDDAAAIAEYLAHDGLAGQCGPFLKSKLLTLNPVERNWYQHREYWPLINARAHQLGPQRKILNPDFFQQYHALLNVLAHRQTLDDEDHLAVSYYMLLQDRFETAIRHFDAADRDSLTGKIQYAYCDAYLDMLREKPESAAEKAEVWSKYPVDHWRNRFKNLLAQVNEIRTGNTKTIDKDDQAQQQTELAAKSESFEFTVAAENVQIDYQNITSVQVNYYEMDIELLFSRSPFAQDELDGFSMIRPNVSKQVKLPIGKGNKKGAGSHSFKLPAELKNKNVLVEVVAGDQAKSQPYFAHSLNLQTIENYGQIHVTQELDRVAIPKSYVKVYARMNDGTVKFHKDGYTDLRGRFDYVSQSNHALDGIEKLSLLILSDKHGAIIRQVDPPQE